MYVKHPTMDGDGVVAIAMPDGTTKQLKMVEGVIDWPDNVPMHNRYVAAPEPEALREIKRQEKEAQLRKLAEELGLEVSAKVETETKTKTTTKKADDKKAE